MKGMYEKDYTIFLTMEANIFFKTLIYWLEFFRLCMSSCITFFLPNVSVRVNGFLPYIKGHK